METAGDTENLGNKEDQSELKVASPKTQSAEALPDKSDVEGNKENQSQLKVASPKTQSATALPDKSDVEGNKENQSQLKVASPKTQSAAALPDKSDVEGNKEEQSQLKVASPKTQSATALPDQSDVEGNKEDQSQLKVASPKTQSAAALPDKSDVKVESKTEKDKSKKGKKKTKDKAKVPDVKTSISETNKENQSQLKVASPKTQSAAALPDQSDVEGNKEDQSQLIVASPKTQSAAALPDKSDVEANKDQSQMVAASPKTQSVVELPDKSDVEGNKEYQSQMMIASPQTQSAAALPDKSDAEAKSKGGKEKHKKGKKKTKSKLNAPIPIPSESITKQEYQSQLMVTTSQIQTEVTPTKSNLLGAASSKKVTKPTSKRFVKSFSQVIQDEDESYSSGSFEEEKLMIKSTFSRKKQLGKGKTVKLTAGDEETEESAPETEKKKKKGKKAKKEKKIKKEEPEKSIAEEPEDDIMLTIMQLKSSARQSESTAQTEPSKPSKKKKKKRSGKKKKDKKITPQMAEQLKIEAEQEAIRQAELEKIRLAEEKLIAIEKEKREVSEARIRDEQLSKTISIIQNAVEYYQEAAKAEQEEEEWKLFVECGNLPNPYFCDQMNTYLHIWEDDIEVTNISDVSSRTENVLKLIESLEELISTSPEKDKNDEKLMNWIWIRQLYRDHQQISLDIATYRLLRKICKNLVRLDIQTADYNFKDSFVTLCLWLRVQLPIPLPNPRRPPKPRIDVTFEELDDIQIILPITMDLQDMALRVMYLKYDHLSDNCEYFHAPPVAPHYELDLKQACNKEWRIKLKYKYDNREKKPRPVIDPENENSVIFESEPEDFLSDEEIPIVPYKKLEPTASEYAFAIEEKEYAESAATFVLDLPNNVVNLRKFVILGGVYHINLLAQPPQPQDYVILDLNITRLFIPKQLEHVDFFVAYEAPVPSDPDVRKQPEEIEEEMKKNEEALDSLIYINLTWPKHVIFLELPIVCIWDTVEKCWSTEYVHDLKHCEEKGTLSFRTQVFGIFGLATLKYTNLPYQAWEIKPEENGSVSISITSAILIFEFNILDGKICLLWIQNSPNNALTPYIGKYMNIYELKKIFKNTGIDIFPDHDAFCYVEGSCEKHWPMEKNLYTNMAVMSGCFNFAWSRWNLSLGRRSIVLLMREYSFDKSKQKNFSTLLICPTQATIINCTEVSQEFSDEPAESIKFCADLYNLMKTVSGIAIRKKVEEVSKLNVYTVSEFLIATRVLSFS